MKPYSVNGSVRSLYTLCAHTVLLIWDLPRLWFAVGPEAKVKAIIGSFALIAFTNWCWSHWPCLASWELSGQKFLCLKSGETLARPLGAWCGYTHTHTSSSCQMQWRWKCTLVFTFTVWLIFQDCPQGRRLFRTVRPKRNTLYSCPIHFVVLTASALMLEIQFCTNVGENFFLCLKCKWFF